jgi:hypothetical protein
MLCFFLIFLRPFALQLPATKASPSPSFPSSSGLETAIFMVGGGGGGGDGGARIFVFSTL